LGRDGRLEAKTYTRVIFESPAALRVWCIAAGFALAPMPILYAVPTTFFIDLYESAPAGWLRITRDEAYEFTLFGLPLTAIFLAWSLPGAGRPGLPLRSIVVLCLLVAYHPLQSYFESHFYGEFVARTSDSFSQESPLIWSIRHLDTPLLIALATTALRWRRALPPHWKILFHWGLFVCVLWAAGHPYDSVFFDILLLHAFGM
jgi:hypothetical protein